MSPVWSCYMLKRKKVHPFSGSELESQAPRVAVLTQRCANVNKESKKAALALSAAMASRKTPSGGTCSGSPWRPKTCCRSSAPRSSTWRPSRWPTPSPSCWRESTPSASPSTRNSTSPSRNRSEEKSGLPFHKQSALGRSSELAVVAVGTGLAQLLERAWDRNSRFAAMLTRVRFLGATRDFFSSFFFPFSFSFSLSLSESAFSADSLTCFPRSLNICVQVKNPNPLAATTRLDARKILRTHGRNG